jgi:hypothetical protein
MPTTYKLNSTQLEILKEWLEAQQPILDRLVVDMSGVNTILNLQFIKDRDKFLDFLSKYYAETASSSKAVVRQILSKWHNIARGSIHGNTDIYNYITHKITDVDYTDRENKASLKKTFAILFNAKLAQWLLEHRLYIIQTLKSSDKTISKLNEFIIQGGQCYFMNEDKETSSKMFAVALCAEKTKKIPDPSVLEKLAQLLDCGLQSDFIPLFGALTIVDSEPEDEQYREIVFINSTVYKKVALSSANSRSVNEDMLSGSTSSNETALSDSRAEDSDSGSQGAIKSEVNSTALADSNFYIYSEHSLIKIMANSPVEISLFKEQSYNDFNTPEAKEYEEAMFEINKLTEENFAKVTTFDNQYIDQSVEPFGNLENHHNAFI